MARSVVAALIAFFAFAASGRAQVVDVERELARIVDASLSDADRQASWTAVERAVDALAASREPLDDASARALFVGADFYLRCVDDGAYEAERAEPAARAALRAARVRAAESERAATYAYRLARADLARLDTRAAREVLDDTLAAIGERPASARPACLLLRGVVDRLESRTVEAFAWFDRALAALDPAKQPTHRVLAPSVHAEIAAAWLDLGLPELAAVAVDRQRAAAQGIVDPVVVHALSLQESRVDIASGRWSRARQRARAAASDATTSFPGWTRIRAQHRLLQGRAAQELAAVDAAAAREELELLTEAARTPDLPRNDRVEALLALFARHARAGDAAAASEVLARATREVEASKSGGATLQGVRLAAARAREARMRRAEPSELVAVRDALRAAWSDFLALWNRTPIQADGVGFLQYSYRRAVPCELVDAELAVDSGPAGVERAFRTLLEAQASGTIARTLGVVAPSLGELRAELLAPGETIVAFLPGPGASHAFVLDARTLAHERLAPESELQGRQVALARELDVRPDEGRTRAEHARPLADALFRGAVARAARSTRLTITGLDVLGFLPAAALDVDGVGVLGLAVEIAELPSLPLGLAFARRRARDASALGTDLLVLAAPTASAAARASFEPLPALPWTDDDERAVIGGAPSSRVVVLAGAAARADAVRARRPRVLTVHAHGVADPHRSPAACVVLAPEREGDEGVLHVSDAASAFAVDAEGRPPELVVLAVCRTSRAAQRRGDDGGNHFGGALLRAGAQCVLLSGADLEDDATRVLLAALHRELRGGATPARALLVARRAVAADPRRAHPHFHALLVASGLAHRAVLREDR